MQNTLLPLFFPSETLISSKIAYTLYQTPYFSVGKISNTTLYFNLDRLRLSYFPKIRYKADLL